MSLRQRYSRLLAEVLSAGVAGVSLLLGSTVPGDATLPPTSPQPGVAERLAAIRDAVSDVIGAPSSSNGEQQLAWGNWWRNGPWRNGGWGNWRNGWHNGWPNWWHNW
ncbi:MAG TPA: hypothetical protein VE687_17395 [Stellaceae bacterium]|nr:hypothetical protein [Stellaceae bacterium]